jgi:acyl-CoA dehydrogenase family protein 10
MQALKKSAVPVPNTRLFCRDTNILGTPFFVYDYVDGRFFRTPELKSVKDPSDRTELFKNMIETLAKLHSVDVDAVGLGDYGVRVGAGPGAMPYLIRQVKTWAKAYRATETDESIDDMDFLIERLPDLLPKNAEKQSTLVHGDYRMDNMIFDRDSNSVKAVLDWELSTLGDNLCDLASIAIIYTIDPKNPMIQGLKGIDYEATGLPSLEKVIDMYGKYLTEHSEGRLSAPTVDDMDYYIAYSFFKFCGILQVCYMMNIPCRNLTYSMQGVYKRALMGTASAPNALSAREFAKETARLGRFHLERYTENTQGRRKFSTSASSRGDSSQAQAGVEASALFEPFLSARAKDLLKEAVHFIDTEILPLEKEMAAYCYESPDKFSKIHPKVEELKAKVMRLDYC